MKVLIVDDSVVFRTQISNALSEVNGIEVAGTAAHGKIALQKLEQGKIDVVTLDMEMPEMNGIDVLKEIRKRKFPVRVIIFSSQTQKGAEAALNALHEGADDVIAKPSGDGLSFETAAIAIREVLVPKVLQFFDANPLARKNSSLSDNTSVSNERSSEIGLRPTPLAEPVQRHVSTQGTRRDLSMFLPSVILIGSSTGGPNALEKIFEIVTAPISVPILITQHMPPVFTEILAKRLGEISGIPAQEAKAGESLQKNRIYVAPGNFHMEIGGTADAPILVLHQKDQRNSVRPAVDYLFESGAALYKKNCMGVVLTGMGEDGLVGAKAIRSGGGGMLIQDKASCVVFGMPGAIFEANEYDQISDLMVIAHQIKKMAKKNL